MARINTNVSSLISRHNLNRANDDLQVRLQRLSTGLRINSGSDDPAGLIISERLRSEIEGIGQAISNAERASNVIATSEASLAEIANLLNSIKSLAVESANSAAMSIEEIEANQMQVDSAVDSITRIANTTSFAGLKLLNGSLDYITSGVATSAISDVSIKAANFGTATTMPVNVEIISSAQKSALFVSTGTTTIPSAITLEIAGAKGVEVLQFASGSALSTVAFAINQSSDSTGVIATIVSGAAAGLSALQFQSDAYGTDAFVSVNKVPGTTGGDFFQTYDAVGAGGVAVNRDTGEDVLALVNGSLALGQGTVVKVNTQALKLEMQLTEDYAQTTGAAGVKSFTITGGGATFQLGPNVESAQQVSLALQSVAANRLGSVTTGFLNFIVSGGEKSLISGNASDASDIIDEAIEQISVFRGRLGAFERNTLQTDVRSLQISLENLTSSESRIRDADYAEEVSKLNRAQILTQTGISVLRTANQSAGNIISLLQ